MRGLRGKAIVVTGAGAGIGRAVAVQVARAGGRVVVNDVQRPRVDDVVGGIRAAGGVAVPDYGSVSEWENGTALVDKWVSQFERIDGPVNNAAIRPVRDPWDETDESIREVVGVNLAGAVSCATSAMTIVRAQGSGSNVLRRQPSRGRSATTGGGLPAHLVPAQRPRPADHGASPVDSGQPVGVHRASVRLERATS
jgi:NAD(P)-dependent dehydrogenase (short-subunit alcohol dehydrogenase family)